METPSGSTSNIEPREARKAVREHNSNVMKRTIKKLVVDLFPRDSEGFVLSESADTPYMSRPPWVMDELYRSLKINWETDDATKGLKYVVSYVMRERIIRRQRVISSNTDKVSE
jgi:hypothetical protein